MSNEILAAWERTLERRGNAPAIVSPSGAVMVTFAGLEAEARAFEAGLPSPDALPPGAVVALQTGHGPALSARLLALWRRGCVPVLLDAALEGPSRTAALALCGVRRFFGTGDTMSWEAESPAAPLLPETQFLKLTSGTTGHPRAIQFTAAQLLADADAVCATMGITERDLNYGVIPWSHSYGFSNLVTPLLCHGVPVVACEDRLPRAILAGLANSGATVFPGLPVLYQKLAELDAPRLPRLRLCISAGAPLNGSVARAFRERFGVKVRGFYGSSECGGIAYDASEEEVPEGCVGQPLRGVELQHDESVGEGAGRIEIRGPAVGLGYFPEPDEAVLGAGRFVPGDLVRRTAQGLVLTGRVSDFVNVAGRKLNPAEVEAVVRAFPGVREAVVFGVPHALRGEEPVACVVAPGVAIEALQAHCAAALARWQWPRDFWVVEQLPINERGKLSRALLAERYRAARRPSG
jgi:long-chain acyl-CoA synthetase